MAAQLTHRNTTFTTAKKTTILVCDGVTSPANIGGIFRLCDSFGIEKIYFCGTKIDLTSPRIKRTSRSTHLLVNYTDDIDTLGVLKQLTKQGVALLSPVTSVMRYKLSIHFLHSVRVHCYLNHKS